MNRENRRTLSASVQRTLAMTSARLIARAAAGRTGIAVSVVMVSRNHATYLDLTLAALEHQVFPGAAWEVVVVDNASNDETPLVLQKYAQRGRLPLVFRRPTPRKSPGEAHNEALAISRGRLVVFLGDDRLTAPDYLLRHLVRHVGEPGVVIGDGRRLIHTHIVSLANDTSEGVCANPFLDGDDLAYQERLGELALESGGDCRTLCEVLPHHSQVTPLCWVCFDAENASAPRELVLRAGGFDEGFPTWGLGTWGLAEQDLAYRLYRLGIPFHFEARACTLQQFRPSEPVPWSQAARMLCYFFAKYPDLDRTTLEPILLRSR